jgi:hypothetical protein
MPDTAQEQTEGTQPDNEMQQESHQPDLATTHEGSGSDHHQHLEGAL